MNSFLSLFRASIRESLRNKGELSFNLFFPLLFLLIFGSLQRGSDDYRRTWMGFCASPGIDLESVVGQSGVWEPRSFASEAELREAIRKGELNIGLCYDGSRARFLYKEGDPRAESKLRMAQLSITAALEREANRVRPLLTVSRHPQSAGRVKASAFDYTLAGIISISILSIGLLSVVVMFGRYRKSGVLNQLRIAPLRPLSFIMGVTLSRMILSFFSLLIILGVSLVIMKASFAVNWLLLIITMISSTLGMMALGLLLTLLFRNPETANTSAGILMFVMHFLAGIFFPIALLPAYMKVFSAVLPLKYVAILVRHSLGIELVSMSQFALTSLCLTAGGLLMLWLTGRKFLSAGKL